MYLLFYVRADGPRENLPSSADEGGGRPREKPLGHRHSRWQEGWRLEN